jgi:hypothetical protein
MPGSFALQQNYPNPFNPGTTIQFSLPHEPYVSLKVYEVLGQEVLTLVNGTRSPGIYFYTLQAGSFIQTRWMMVIK